MVSRAAVLRRLEALGVAIEALEERAYRPGVTPSERLILLQHRNLLVAMRENAKRQSERAEEEDPVR